MDLAFFAGIDGRLSHVGSSAHRIQAGRARPNSQLPVSAKEPDWPVPGRFDQRRREV